MLLLVDDFSLLQLRVDAAIDLCTRAVVGRDHQRALGRSRILLGNCYDASFRARDLMHPALPLEPLHGLSDLSVGELLDYLLQLQISLAHNLIKGSRQKTDNKAR